MGMEVLRSPKMVREALFPQLMRGRSVGLVPTMGALHNGHMALVRDSVMENDLTVASIFVNPAQFGPGEDLDNYPRDTDSDLSKLREAGVDILFMPSASEMYDQGFSTFVDVGPITAKLCGAFRPTHFRGVATVVTKLFNIVSPARAYFGQKDYQQVLVIRKIARELNMPVDVVGCPTIRESDGIAMSSRNAYLSEAQRSAAPVLYRALSAAAEALKGGDTSPQGARVMMEDMIKAESLIDEVQYIGCYDPDTLDWLEEFSGGALLAGAIKIGRTRLIDNVLVVS